VKLATLLMLIGGPRQEDERGTHLRGEVHMLLIGDPGTGTTLPGPVGQACHSCLCLPSSIPHIEITLYNTRTSPWVGLKGSSMVQPQFAHSQAYHSLSIREIVLKCRQLFVYI
jgi:DNA replicative helicase MCM subunit Mcm2 (Cdc46/Mcm family)